VPVRLPVPGVAVKKDCNFIERIRWSQVRGFKLKEKVNRFRRIWWHLLFIS